jgi:butyrate kinase
MNLVDLGLTVFMANALTNGLVNSNLMDFFTGNRDGVYRAGADGAYRVTLPEMIKGINTGSGSWNKKHGDALGPIIARNFGENWGTMAFAIIGAPVIVKAATKILRKPILTPLNRAIKQTGLDVKL